MTVEIYNIVIFDDDKTQCEIIKKMVDEYRPELLRDIVLMSDRNELDRYMEFHNRLDILITDICIDETGETGIDIVKKLHVISPSTQIIYTTGYVEYCEEVDKAVRNIAGMEERIHRITNGHNIINLKPENILYIESNKRKLVYTCTDGIVEAYGKLSDIEQQLRNEFVRCHKSFLVNIEHIKELRDNDIRLDNGKEVAVSRKYYADTRKTLLSYTIK